MTRATSTTNKAKKLSLLAILGVLAIAASSAPVRAGVIPPTPTPTPCATGLPPVSELASGVSVLADAPAATAVAEVVPAVVAAPAAAAVPATAASCAPITKTVPVLKAAKFVTAIDASVASLAAAGGTATDPAAVALALAAHTLDIPASELRIKDILLTSPADVCDLAGRTTGSGDDTVLTAVHLRQVVHGLEIVNADVNVNVDASGRVISYGDRLFRGARPSAPPALDSPAGRAQLPHTPESAFVALAAALGIDASVAGVKEITPADAAAAAAEAGTAEPEPEFAAQAAGQPQAALASACTFEITAPAAKSPVPAKFAYLQTDAGELALVYDFVVDTGSSWYNAHVNAVTGAVEAIFDWSADAQYSVVPPQTDSPVDGAGITTLSFVSTASTASPLGWHDQGVAGAKFTDTRGNNVLAEEDRAGDGPGNGRRAQGGTALQFTARPDLTIDPATGDNNADAATTNLFFWNNIMHDVTYRFGFDERSGNFQQNNLGRGGLQYDPVVATAQDAAAPNNAFMATPPDGTSPRMSMGLFTTATPRRDSDLDPAVIAHEFFHGVSNRLTGGPANANCLNTLESAGLGEGWSDTMALAVTAKPAQVRSTPRPLSTWLVNNANGLRTYPYNAGPVSATTNPTTFQVINTAAYQEVHKLGEVWASALWEVYWNLIDRRGFRALVSPQGKVAALVEAAGAVAAALGSEAAADQVTDVSLAARGVDDEALVASSGSGGRRPRPSPQPTPLRGNELFMQIMINALKIQPCNPSFLEARDAFLQAEAALTRGGVYRCDVWRGFAKRGLGPNASGNPASAAIVEDFTLPADCN
ncbi:hypothetical protein H9P43_005145 [Blastocladiella emersonii ATCC 22665]|nr:hypothetical protein H9P43_005145 [Blastocladiella emersonii ATCC 22665]